MGSMSLDRSSTPYHSMINHVLIVVLGTALGLPARGSAQEAGPGDEVGPTRQEDQAHAPEQAESPEQSRQQRLDHLRRCQVCPREGFGFEFSIPIFLPLAVFSGSGDGDENGDGTEEGTPQLLDFQTRLRFGLEGGLTFRVRNVTLRMWALAVNLGNHVVLNLRDQSKTLGRLGLWAILSNGIVKWNTPTLRIGKAARPTQVALWPYAGGRFVVLIANAEGAGERLMLSNTLFWGEPLVGLETIFDPPSGWSVYLDANVGGFTVGADVSTHVHARANYHFTSWFAIGMGYQIIYARGRPGNRLIDEYNLFLHGPTLSLRFSTP
jgi:hypothetical protein